MRPQSCKLQVSMLCVDTTLRSTQLLLLATFCMMQPQTASLLIEQARIKVRVALVLCLLLVPGLRPGLGLGRIPELELDLPRQELGLN
jgi:hypothetical protein